MTDIFKYLKINILYLKIKKLIPKKMKQLIKK